MLHLCQLLKVNGKTRIYDTCKYFSNALFFERKRGTLTVKIAVCRIGKIYLTIIGPVREPFYLNYTVGATVVNSVVGLDQTNLPYSLSFKQNEKDSSLCLTFTALFTVNVNGYYERAGETCPWFLHQDRFVVQQKSAGVR